MNFSRLMLVLWSSFLTFNLGVYVREWEEAPSWGHFVMGLVLALWLFLLFIAGRSDNDDVDY